MKRDKKGRFTSETDDNRGYLFTLSFPSIKNLILWTFILIILLPWAITIERANILQKLLNFIDNILMKKEESETSKKNGLFY